MTVPSEFVLLHYGKKIAIIPKCIMHLLISYLVFLSGTQKPSIVLYFKGLDFPVLLAVVQASDSMTASM